MLTRLHNPNVKLTSTAERRAGAYHSWADGDGTFPPDQLACHENYMNARSFKHTGSPARTSAFSRQVIHTQRWCFRTEDKDTIVAVMGIQML